MGKVKKPLFIRSISQSDVPTTGPFLTAVLFAEEVLSEDASNMITIKRVVDRAGLSPDAIKDVAKGAHITLPIKLLITFKAGGFKGNSLLALCQTNPSGEFNLVGESTVKFDGQPNSNAYII